MTSPSPTAVLDAASTLGDVYRLQAEHRPDKTALTTLDGCSVTFGEINRRVNRLNHVAVGFGLRPGNRVAVLSRNRPEVVEAFGLTKSGLVVVPLNWRLTPAETLRILHHCTPALVLADDQGCAALEPLREQWPAGMRLLSLDDSTPSRQSVAELIQDAPSDEPPASSQPADAACIVYTSGTTGHPKGATLTHAGLLANARTAATEMLGLSDSDRVMSVMPLFHVGGMWYHLFPSFAVGCSALILAEFDAGVVLRQLEARRITNVHLVPTMISTLLDDRDCATADLSHLRMLFYAASSMPAELLSRAMQRLPVCDFAQSYGSTEAGVVCLLSPRDHRRAREANGAHLLTSCGRPFRQRDVRLVDDSGRSVSAGAVGEVEVRSPGRMRSYWNDPTSTSKAMDGGWLRTGDLARRDDDGYFYIVDRRNDMIVSGGENVYPSEVEAALCSDPDVQEASVFGLPDPKWVQKVAAAVVLRPGAVADEQTVIAWLRERLAGYKCPKVVFFVDTLPKNAAGKVIRTALRQRFEQTP